MRVAVLGSGMAGLLSAKAVEDVTGERATIISDRPARRIEWDQTYGIHVLHDNCGLGVREMFVTNLVITPLFDDGKPQLLVALSDWERRMANGTYGQKVYGSRKASTSLMRMPGVIEGYEYVTAFNTLVNKFGPDVTLARPQTENSMHKLCKGYDLVFSSVPRHAITPKWVKHPFSIAYVSNTPPLGFEYEVYMGENFVVYNADPTYPWSRTSRVIHGGAEFWSTEYVTVPTYFITDLHQVEKVVTCEAFGFPQNLIPIGRQGEWKPGVLAHDAYWKTVEELRRHVR